MRHARVYVLKLAMLLLLACRPAASPDPTGTPAPKPGASSGQEEPQATGVGPAATATLAPLPWGAPARQIENSGYKDGDTLSFIVPFAPGGGYDRQARILQPFLEKALRQVTGMGVRVVVQNMPGAQNRVALEHVNRSPPDGRTVVYISSKNTVGHQVLGGADFDLARLTLIGSLSGSYYGIAVTKKLQLPERTLLGMVTRSQQVPILMAYPGGDTEGKFVRALLKDKGVPLNFDLVSFDGTSPMLAALLRGDVEAGWTTIGGMAQFVEENSDKLELLVNMGCERDYAAPDLTTIVEQKAPNADVICRLAGDDPRLLVGPPAMPPGIAEALAESFRVAVNDPEHLAASLKIGFKVVYQGPTQAHGELMDLVRFYATYRPNLQ